MRRLDVGERIPIDARPVVVLARLDGRATVSFGGAHHDVAVARLVDGVHVRLPVDEGDDAKLLACRGF